MHPKDFRRELRAYGFEEWLDEPNSNSIDTCKFVLAVARHLYKENPKRYLKRAYSRNACDGGG